MSRPYKFPPEPLNKILNIRITESLKEKISDAAQAANLTEHEVIRRKLAGIKIPHKNELLLTQEIRLLRQELARRGGLIKHLYSENPINAEETARLLRSQRLVIENITSILNEMAVTNAERKKVTPRDH